MKISKRIKTVLVAAAAFITVFTGAVNVNQSFADTLSDIPIIGGLVEVLSFRFDSIETENVHANIETPVISGLENETLEAVLNQKYYDENKALYEDFREEMKAIEAEGGHLGVDSGFVVKTDTDRILSIGRYYVNTVASSSTTFKYDTVDKLEGVLLTLPSLFTDERYVDMISEYLVQYMKDDMTQTPDNVYWVLEDDFTIFEKIKVDQYFYLTENNKLVISFDKY